MAISGPAIAGISAAVVGTMYYFGRRRDEERGDRMGQTRRRWDPDYPSYDERIGERPMQRWLGQSFSARDTADPHPEHLDSVPEMGQPVPWDPASAPIGGWPAGTRARPIRDPNAPVLGLAVNEDGHVFTAERPEDTDAYSRSAPGRAAVAPADLGRPSAHERAFLYERDASATARR